MPRISDYASLVQGILDYTHNTKLSSYVDYFIQGAQEQIANDIVANNFGQGLRFMEAPYGPLAIGADGTAPVPSDWVAPRSFKLFTASDEFDLEFKDPRWLYSRYPLRGSDGVPVYIARDTYAPNGAPSGLMPSVSFTAVAGQTVFSLTALNGPVVFVSVNGAVLAPTLDYIISGNTLTLSVGSSAGDAVVVQGVTPSFSADNQTFIATAGQTAFVLSPMEPVILVTLDGVVLEPGSDYTISGSTINLSQGALVGQTVVAFTSTSLIDSGDDQLLTMDGQTSFLLAAPPGSQVLLVALDGAVLTSGTDFTLNGAMLTLTDGALLNQTLFVRYVSTGLISGTSVFVFGPFPNEPYTIAGTYYQMPPTLSSDQPTNWLTASAPSLLHAACLVEAGKFLKDVKMVDGWSQVYNGKLDSLLMRDVAERYGSGPLVINAA